MDHKPGPVSREGLVKIKRAMPDTAGANTRVEIGYIFSYFQSSSDQTVAAQRQVLQAAEETSSPVLIRGDLD